MKKFLFTLIALFALAGPVLAQAFTVTLQWQDNSADETGFGIQAASSCIGTFADIAKVGANVTTFTDSNATPGKCYRVYAFNAAGNSPFSNTAAAPNTPNAPSNLRLSFNTPDSLAATWDDGTTGEAYFKLTTVSQSPPLRTVIDYPPADATHWIITGLRRNRLHCSTIVAVLKDGQTGPSNQACAST